MSWELVYTSVPRGLRPNTSGFCTVAVTAGMSRAVMQTIERISAYEFHFGLSDPRANENPINYLHMLLPVGGRAMHLLSRIAYAGADYSGRTNKIAHHILLSPEELSPAGPADMIRQLVDAGRFYSTWAGEPRELAPSSLAAGLGASPAHADPPATWRSLTGDAGWAGMLVKGFRENARVPAYLLFEPGLDILQLYQESLALLPPELRWEVGFSTYYYANLLPADSKVHWRAVVSGSPLARTEVTKYPNAVVLDLTHPLGSPPANQFVTAAREGRTIESARPTPAQPQGRPGGASIDISQALKPRQSAPVSKDLLTPVEYDAPPPQQPSPALQPALADYGYPDYSQKTVDIPRRTSRWTWVFAVAAFLLLLSNAVTLLLLVPGRTDLQDERSTKLATATKVPKAAKPAPSDPEKDKRPQDANSTTQDPNNTRAQKEQSKTDALTSITKKSPEPTPATQAAANNVATKQSIVTSHVASQPASQPVPTTAPKDTAKPKPETTAEKKPERIHLNINESKWTEELRDKAKDDLQLSGGTPTPGKTSSVEVPNTVVSIYKPPGELASYVNMRYGDDPNTVSFFTTTEPRIIATCWLEASNNAGKKKLLVKIPPPSASEVKDKILRESLVILLVAKGEKVGYRIPLRETVKADVKLTVGPDKAMPDTEVITFNYQCPRDLTLLLDGKVWPIPLDPSKTEGQSANGFGQSPALAIRFTDRTHMEVTLLGGLAVQTTPDIKSWTRQLTAADIKRCLQIDDCIRNPDKAKTTADGLIKDTEKALTNKENKEDIKATLRKDLAALKASLPTLVAIAKERKTLMDAVNDKVIEFRDPSGHVVQKIKLNVIWGAK